MAEGRPVISVRGEAQLEVEPEVADVTVTVEARDRDRRVMLDQLAGRNREVLDLVRGFGEAVEKVVSDSSSVHPEFDQNGPFRKVVRYTGRVTVRLTVRDFTILGELVSKLGSLELASVAGPWWALRLDSPARRQARLLAAQDATRRAAEYAEAFGGTLGELIEAADRGLLGGNTGGERVFAGARAASGHLAGADAPVFEFEPAKQVVSAQVEARFTMIPSA